MTEYELKVLKTFVDCWESNNFSDIPISKELQKRGLTGDDYRSAIIKLEDEGYLTNISWDQQRRIPYFNSDSLTNKAIRFFE